MRHQVKCFTTIAEKQGAKKTTDHKGGEVAVKTKSQWPREGVGEKEGRKKGWRVEDN